MRFAVKRFLQFSTAIALLVGLALPAMAGYSERTRQLCFKLKYAERERLADQGDPDATYCSAVWNAAAYTDETKSQQERRAHRVRAIERYRAAVDLGYTFDRIAMFGMTFDQLIADGDRLTANGGARRPAYDPQGAFMGCMGRLGVQCSAQCGGNMNCQAACTSNNAWQCRQ